MSKMLVIFGGPEYRVHFRRCRLSYREAAAQRATDSEKSKSK